MLREPSINFREASGGDGNRKSFDLGLAVALAGCAFEAYNEPEGAEGYKELALNGTTTTYVDRCACTQLLQAGLCRRVFFICDGLSHGYRGSGSLLRAFLQEKMAGLLMVHLESATNLPARDVWGTSDPYVEFTIGGSSYRSKTIMRELNPTWDEAFYLYVR